MLFFLGQDRSYLAEAGKPDGLLRVVFVGDSMVFGQGCLPTETLPYQLETVLNGALWDRQVEVVNGGVCGYSIHDAWERYRHKFAHFRPDLVVLAVCDNDAELFHHREATDERVRCQTYLEFSESCYDPAGQHFPYFALRLREMAESVRQGGPPVVLAFYDIHGGEHRDLLMPRIREACRAAGVPFADLSQDFLGTAAATRNRELKVSDADHHPSPLAHGIAARRLARILLDEGLLQRSGGTPRSESDVVGECCARTDEAVRGGANPCKALAHLHRTLIAKRDSRARSRMTAADQLNDAAHRAVMASVEQAWQAFNWIAVWESHRGGYPQELEQFGFGLSLFDMTLAKVAKAMFVAARRLDDPSLPVVDQFEGALHSPPVRLPAEVGAKLEGWRRKHQTLRELAARTLPVKLEDAGQFPWCAGRLATLAQGIARQVEPLWRDAELVLAAAERTVAECDALADRVARAGRTDVHGPLALTCELLEVAVNHLDFFLTPVRYDTLSLLSRGIDQPAPTAVTMLRVTVTAPDCRHPFTNSEPPSLEVWLKSAAPFARVTSDIHTIVRDGLPRVYRFALPFFVEGELRLGLEGASGLEIGTVQLSNAEQRAITLSAWDFEIERDGQVYRAKRVFVPV